MLLTDEEIDSLWFPDGITKPQIIVRRAIVKAAEKAILAKLASAELPEPTVYSHNVQTHMNVLDAYSADQLRQAYAQGAAAQLAEKPRLYAYTVNKVHNEYCEFEPLDDAYDEGTLTPSTPARNPNDQPKRHAGTLGALDAEAQTALCRSCNRLAVVSVPSAVLCLRSA